MMLKLFLLLCLIDTTLSRLQTVPHKYYLIIEQVTWTAAQEYCRDNYVDLATVVSDDDWVRLKKEADSKGLKTYAWVGLYNNANSWYWSYNAIPLGTLGFTNWYGSQPDNAGGQESCIGMGPYGFWWDSNCDNLKPFICYDARYTGAKKFVGVNSPKSWPEALAYCRKSYTDLAFIQNSEDNNLVNDFTYVYGHSWIGLTRDTWKWSDQTNASTLQWLPSAPNNNYGGENCAVVYNSGLDDDVCTKLYYFFCETFPPWSEQQVLKLHVQDSHLDISVAQLSVLQQVKQKLEERGMKENITVTWKLHPNGTIFRKKP